jgi:uncharacterized protein
VRALLLALVLAAVLAVGATAALQREVAPSAAAATFPRGTATIATGKRTIALRVELARTDAQRQQGLMNRRTLAANAGMVFQYPSLTRGAFWMKNTLIPLDIAFYDGRGIVLRTMRMQPCVADPCPVYDPGVAYRGALEVNGGSFRRWGVKRGARIVVKPAR